MVISEITIQDLKDYARIDHIEDDFLFSSILEACKSYIKSYTGLTLEQMDEKEDLPIALFVLSNELYENRTFTVKDDKVNVVIKSILDMHSVNLL
ncbi:head-tail connector protein [Bacillus sp. ISL-7]|uniref:head-tail connector protein n=1 Tax=Bacillus sp. ISL-7 TaxID=2819136 RepID=UPI001BE531E5|nr:head-tail connector protein [Bacillus sp. ISL-7]MBT2736161.1 phage gp6-like head-tail connector protein [Bacillus sp. ISL-7]